MKRKTLLLTILGLFIAVPAFAGAITYTLSPVKYPVLINGFSIKGNLPIMTYRANGGDNTYVPLKSVLDIMGAKTTWDGKTINVSTGVDAAKVADSVVEIYVSKDGVDVSQGSGVLIDYDEILTCSHVVHKGDAYRIVFNDGHTTTAKLEDDAPNADAAILEPNEQDTKPVKIGDSEEIQKGNKVFIISSPKEKKNTIQKGDISSTYSLFNSVPQFDISTPVEPGGSGGGVFNNNGELIGLLSVADYRSSSAVPINQTKKALSE